MCALNGARETIMFQHHVAVSLFVNVLRARQNSYLSASDHHGLFGVYFTEGHVGNQMGWVMVSDNTSGPSYWNKRLKDRMDVHCLFSNDRYGPIPRVGDTVDLDRDWQALQVSAVYPVRALTIKAAADKAWDLFLSGSGNCSEWYDASHDRSWSKFFGQTSYS
jgi:hypothetical protein